MAWIEHLAGRYGVRYLVSGEAAGQPAQVLASSVAGRTTRLHPRLESEPKTLKCGSGASEGHRFEMFVLALSFLDTSQTLQLCLFSTLFEDASLHPSKQLRLTMG